MASNSAPAPRPASYRRSLRSGWRRGPDIPACALAAPRVSLLRRLAAAAFDRRARHLAFQQCLRHLGAAIDKLARAGAQRLALLHEFDVAVHFLELPAERVRDERELRHEVTDLAEEHHHLPGDRLDAVLAAGDDESRDLVADQHLVVESDLVLDAVHALDHLVIERTRRAPADRRRDQ